MTARLFSDKYYSMLGNSFPLFTYTKSNEPIGTTKIIPFEVSEDDTNILVNAHLPGVQKEDINVELSNSILSISAKRFQLKENALYSNISYGNLKSSIELSKLKYSTNKDVSAKYEDGVLYITIVKYDTLNKDPTNKIVIQ